MILVKTIPAHKETIEELIRQEYRLDELVTVTPAENLQENTEAPSVPGISREPDFWIDTHIHLLPDWRNTQPPLLFPGIAFSGKALLGLIYVKLGNFEKAWPLLSGFPGIMAVADLLNRIQYGIEPVDIPVKEEGWHHNHAVSLHYGNNREIPSREDIQSAYELALTKTGNEEWKDFAAKQYAVFLTDNNRLAAAEALLQNRLSETAVASRPEHVLTELKATLCSVWIRQLTVPYDNQKLEELKYALWECLQYYEQQQRDIDAAMILYDAAYIAMISNSFSEGLGYINRAISVFEKEQVSEMLAQAQLRKAQLLKIWAQNGNPQFFRAAMQSYIEALKLFTRENAPDVFAEIQHQLGIVYAEIPDEVKKKSIWAAVSVSSFLEALDFYNKIDFPYEFAVICNDFGNAYTKYPAAMHSDNFDKALSWYREALDVQDPLRFPLERTLTLLNYLEASWFAGNQSDFDEARYEDMVQKAKEILSLGAEQSVLQAAEEHLVRLEELKSITCNFTYGQ